MRFVLSLAVALMLSCDCSAQLMPSAEQAKLEQALPVLADKRLNDVLHGRTTGKRLFYTGKEIPHAQQDHPGGRMGFFLSSHSRSANPDGFPGTDNEFPWRFPGGTDQSKVYTFKIMFLPADTKVAVVDTTLRSYFAGVNGGTFFGGGRESDVPALDWNFPEGTVFFEVLCFGDRLQAFEVRTREKAGNAKRQWSMNLFRPFVTRDELVAAVDGLSESPALGKWGVDDRTTHPQRKAFESHELFDMLPSLGSTEEVDDLLDRPFGSAMNRAWDVVLKDGKVTQECLAPSTLSNTSIVPRNYNGAFVGTDRDGCVKCHQDAGTHLRFFANSREWYGFVRGSKSEQILSFHPVDPITISRNGTRRDAALSAKLLLAGIIEDKRKVKP